MVTWEQIIALPEYQQASPEKKEKAKQAYLALMKSKAEKGNRDILGGSVVTSGVEKANEQRKQEAEVQRRARAQMTAMKQKGVKVPEEEGMKDEPFGPGMYDPVDLLVDAVTGGGASLAKGGLALGKAALAKAVLKGAARDVATGASAGGAMALADKAGGGAVTKFVAGLGGAAGASGIIKGTRSLIASMMKLGMPESQAARIVGEMTPEAVEKAVKAIEPTPGRIGKQTPVKRIGIAQAADAAKTADDVTLHPEAEDYTDMMADYTPTQGRQAIPPVEAQGAKAQAVTEKYRYAKAPKEGPYGVEDTVKPVDKVEVVAKPEPETDPYLGQTEGFVPEEAIDVGKRVPIPEGVRHLPKGVTRGEDGKLYITIAPAKRRVKVEATPQATPQVTPQVTPEVTSKTQQPWEMTLDEFRASELAVNKYRDALSKNPKAMENFNANAETRWRDSLLKRAEVGRLPNSVLDDLASRNGNKSVFSLFRGVKEKGVDGWLPPETRVQGESELRLEARRDAKRSQVATAEKEMFALEDKKARLSEANSQLSRGKPLDEFVLSEFPSLKGANDNLLLEIHNINRPEAEDIVQELLGKIKEEGITQKERAELESLLAEYPDLAPKVEAGQVGEVTPHLLHRRDLLEARLQKLNGIAERARETDMPGPFVTGNSGIPASRRRKLDAQLDRTIDNAKEYIKTVEELELTKNKIAYQENAPTRAKVEAVVASKAQARFDSIEVGDTIDIGGNVPLKVIKKNAKTIVTDGGSKWTAREIHGVNKTNPALAPKVEAPSGIGPSVPKAAMSDPGGIGIVSDEYLGKVPQPIRRFFGGLLEYRYGQPEEYKQIAEGALNTTAYVSTQARKMVDSAKSLAQKLKVADSDVLNYLQGYTANVPKELADELDTIRATIDKWGDEAVKATLLSPEKRKAGYLARLYERHLIDAYEPTLEARQGAINWLIQSKNAANEEEAESLIQSILEGNGVKLVNGPAIPAKLDMGRFMERQDVPYPIRQLLGEVSNPYYLAYRSIKDVARDVTQVKLFKQIAENPLWASKTAKPGFVKINKSALPKGLSHALDTMRDKWGDIGDLYIKKEIAEDLKHTYAEAPEYARMYGVLQSTWKMMKVPMNPATVTTNIISNSILAHLGGVPLWKQAVALPDAMLAVIRSRKGQMDPLYDALEKAHLFTGNYTENELGLLYEGLGLAMNRTKNNGLRLAYALQWAVKKAGGQKAADFYGAVEDTYKYMLAKHYMVSGRGATVQDMLRGKGKKVKLTPEEAVKEAELWLFNYRQLPEPLKALRRTVIPFISWPYFSGKAIARAVVNYPHRVLPILALGYAIDDKMKDEGKDIKLSKYLPYMDTMNEDWGTLGGIPIPPNLNPGGVGVSLYEGFLGRSAHGGRDIFASDDPDSVKAQKQREYFWNTYTPPLAGYAGKRILNAVTGTPKNRYGDVEDVGTALAGSLAGVQIRPDDRVTHYREYKRLMGKIEQEKNFLKWYLKQAYSEADKRERIELARQRIAEFVRQRDASLQALRMARK